MTTPASGYYSNVTSASYSLYSFYYTTVTKPPAHNAQGRGYTLSPTADKVLAVILPILSIPGLFMNVIVLWNLFIKASKLNRPTRQLHGHLVISNFILLILCVPSISLILFNGRIDNPTLHQRVENYVLNNIFCNISGFVFNVMMRMTIHISTALAVDRVLAVQFPIFHKFKVQVYGYNWLIIIIWIFNLVTMATPFIAGKQYVQGPFECVCNWSLDYAVFSRIGEHDHFLRTLVVLSYFFIPFTLTNLLTIICCIWVIVLLLKKNLIFTVEKRKEDHKISTKDNHQYERLQCIKENGHPVDELKTNGHSADSPTTTSNGKQPQIRKNKPTKKLTQSTSILKSIKLSNDAKVKRACYTMLIMMALQLLCYSVVQLMVVDQLLFHVFKANYFYTQMRKNALLAQIFVNYPLYLIGFSILIPAVIHFRMTRNSQKRSDSTQKGFSTINSSINQGLSFTCSKIIGRSKSKTEV